MKSKDKINNISANNRAMNLRLGTIIKTWERHLVMHHVLLPWQQSSFQSQSQFLILKENPLEFNMKHYLQIHGYAMGTRVEVTFANIFMSVIETEIILHSSNKPLVWKRCIDDIFSL